MEQLKMIIFIGFITFLSIDETQEQSLEYIGCYQDQPDRDLDGLLERDQIGNTPQTCLNKCTAAGFAYAGLQAGYACLCGNSYGKYGSVSESICNWVCSGDSSQTCGGSYINAVYKVSNPANCYIHGDPHFNTTDGYTYTFAGEVPCDYVLADLSNVFKVIGTFVPCRTSCLHKVAVDFDGMTFTLGPGDVVESGSTGGAMSTLDLPFNQLDTQVVDNGGHIILTLGAGVAVVWNKDKTANIKIPISFMNNGMTGMCGNFDGNPDNDLGEFNAHDFGKNNMVADSCP